MVRRFIVFSFLTLIFFSGCTKTEKQAGSSTAPNFTLQDLSGKNVALSDLKGKVVLLDFWATWCPPCRASIPGIERLHKTYSSKGLVVLGISLDDGDWDSVKKFAKEAGMTYPVLKSTDEVASKYSVRTIPLVVLVNKEGVVAKQILGYGSDEELENEIKALL